MFPAPGGFAAGPVVWSRSLGVGVPDAALRVARCSIGPRSLRAVARRAKPTEGEAQPEAPDNSLPGSYTLAHCSCLHLRADVLGDVREVAIALVDVEAVPDHEVGRDSE